MSDWVRDGHAVVATFDTDQITVKWECPNSTPQGDVAWDHLPHCRRNWTENGQPDYEDPKMDCCNIEVWVTADSLWDCIDTEVTRGQRIPVQPVTVVGYRWEGECYLWAPSAAIEASQPATPPLVAAPPVPPVVPDSEATCDDCKSPLGDCLVVQERDNEFCCESCSHTEPFGSGVVPDKPALAPEFHCDICGSDTHDDIACDPLPVRARPLPAVTDDEAAAREVLVGAYLSEFPTNEAAADKALAVLRSAGFLIVHHTKET